MPSGAFSSLLWFVAILAMIPAALWLLKRTPAGAMFGGAAGGTMLRSIAALPLSASQRIVTVEVGHGDERRWLVLGVTAQNITTLHTMAPQADPPAPAAALPATPFAQLLGRLRHDKGAAP
ncbi:MAG TPA: flagellar biosynthetic protein FliO [Burkholderiaceae bacterium]|nr:flagellar biosynthetic protein FliO [Burkholderiaceae bacterium]